MKNNNNKVLLMLVFGLIVPSVYAEESIEKATSAKAACEELSEESLSEMGLSPKHWQGLVNQSNQGFSVEGQWKTSNGKYFVECEVGFAQTIDDVEVSIIKA
ncbi:MAG: hypothetical protein HRU24_05550 [Gammaproteobacteria bacterium]|nr:hypothetical protein [Gammaproteobacteria bacterium]